MSAVEKQERYQPEIVVLFCRNCVTQAIDLPSGQRADGGIVVKFFAMPCSSKVESPHLMKVLERGADAVEIVACPDGQCRFLEGNVRAEKRIARLRTFLNQITLGEERIHMDRGGKLGIAPGSRCIRLERQVVVAQNQAAPFVQRRRRDRLVLQQR